MRPPSGGRYTGVPYMTNVKALPLNGLAPSNKDIAAHLRQLADWIEEADAEPLRCVVAVYETQAGQLFRRVCGTPSDRARVNGLLFMQAMQDSTN